MNFMHRPGREAYMRRPAKVEKRQPRRHYFLQPASPSPEYGAVLDPIYARIMARDFYKSAREIVVLAETVTWELAVMSMLEKPVVLVDCMNLILKSDRYQADRIYDFIPGSFRPAGLLISPFDCYNRHGQLFGPDDAQLSLSMLAHIGLVGKDTVKIGVGYSRQYQGDYSSKFQLLFKADHIFTEEHEGDALF